MASRGQLKGTVTPRGKCKKDTEPRHLEKAQQSLVKERSWIKKTMTFLHHQPLSWCGTLVAGGWMVVVVIHRWKDGGACPTLHWNPFQVVLILWNSKPKVLKRKRKRRCPKGPWLTAGAPLQSPLYGAMAFHSPRSSLGPHNHYQVRIPLTLSSSILLGFPFKKKNRVCLKCHQSTVGCTTVQEPLFTD